jgi:hypothetical protein
VPWLAMLSLLIPVQDDAAVALVTRFLALLQDEPSSASSMLDVDGMIAFGDVGFPLTTEGFSSLSEMGCTIQGGPKPYTSPSPLEGGPPAVVVEWECLSDDGSHENHPLKAVFFVDGQQIVAVGFGQAENGPGPERSDDR